MPARSWVAWCQLNPLFITVLFFSTLCIAETRQRTIKHLSVIKLITTVYSLTVLGSNYESDLGNAFHYFEIPWIRYLIMSKHWTENTVTLKLFFKNHARNGFYFWFSNSTWHVASLIGNRNTLKQYMVYEIISYLILFHQNGSHYKTANNKAPPPNTDLWYSRMHSTTHTTYKYDSAQPI